MFGCFLLYFPRLLRIVRDSSSEVVFYSIYWEYLSGGVGVFNMFNIRGSGGDYHGQRGLTGLGFRDLRAAHSGFRVSEITAEGVAPNP